MSETARMAAGHLDLLLVQCTDWTSALQQAGVIAADGE